MDIKEEHLQVTVLETEKLTVIGVYRSIADQHLALFLEELIPTSGNCLFIGDFNLGTNNEIFTSLHIMGFQPLISEATHFSGGHLDQAWLRTLTISHDVHSINLYSPYYNCKDHDALLFSFFDPRLRGG